MRHVGQDIILGLLVNKVDNKGTAVYFHHCDKECKCNVKKSVGFERTDRGSEVSVL